MTERSTLGADEAVGLGISRSGNPTESLSQLMAFKPAKRRKNVPESKLDATTETTALSWAGSGYNKSRGAPVDVDIAATYSSGPGAPGITDMAEQHPGTTLHGVQADDDDAGSATDGHGDGDSEHGSELGSGTGSDDSGSVRSDQLDAADLDGRNGEEE